VDPTARWWRARALLIGISVALAAGGGALAARANPADAPAPVVPVAAAPAPPDLDPVARVAASLVADLRVGLPTPEPPPANAREATPEVRLGHLEIPTIGLSQPLFQGVSLTAIDRGPSHWPGSALPGELGNVVVAGHRTTRTRPFWDLDLVQPGDELIFTMTDGERFVYELDRIEIVDASAIHIIDQGYAHTATLFGCHPKGSARQRIVGHFTLRS